MILWPSAIHTAASHLKAGRQILPSVAFLQSVIAGNWAFVLFQVPRPDFRQRCWRTSEEVGTIRRCRFVGGRR